MSREPEKREPRAARERSVQPRMPWQVPERREVSDSEERERVMAASQGASAQPVWREPERVMQAWASPERESE